MSRYVRVHRHGFRLGLATFEWGVVFRTPFGLWHAKGRRTG